MPSFEEVELDILRRMTPGQKLSVVETLWRQAWSLTAAGVRSRHPGWTEDQVETEVRTIFRDATS